MNKSPLFEIVDSIKFKDKLLDEDFIDQNYNHYMVSRFLSMNPQYCYMISHLQKNLHIMPKKYAYKTLYEILDKDESFHNFIKSSKDKYDLDREFLDHICDKFFVNENQAIRIIHNESNKNPENFKSYVRCFLQQGSNAKKKSTKN